VEALENKKEDEKVCGEVESAPIPASLSLRIPAI